MTKLSLRRGLPLRQYSSSRRPRQSYFRVVGFEWLEDRCLLSGGSLSLAGLPASLTLASGAPLPFALQATDTANPGDALTYTVTSSNPALMNPIIPVGQSIQISTSVGNMTFELFTSLAPNTTQQFINMINAGDFNNISSNTDTFYRIVQGFMIQGGPSAVSVNSFANEYNPDLDFTTAGILAMANTGAANSDSSQFFITDNASSPLQDLGFWTTIIRSLAS